MEFNSRFVWNHKTSGPCDVCLSGYPTMCGCGGSVHAEMCPVKEDPTEDEPYNEEEEEEEPRVVLLQCDKCGTTHDLGPVNEEVERRLTQPLVKVIEKAMREINESRGGQSILPHSQDL